MLCVSIMTDHWEHVKWDHRKLDDIAVKQKNGTQVKWLLEWLLDGQVGWIVYTNSEGLRKVPDRKDAVTSSESSAQDHEVAVFLIPMHGGIWTLCVSLTGKWTTVSMGMATLGECWQPYIHIVTCIKFICTLSSPASPYSHKIWHLRNREFFCVEKKNQLDVTECFIALMIRSTCFGHFYAHHQELEAIYVLLPPMVCSAWLLVVGGQVQDSRL